MQPSATAKTTRTTDSIFRIGRLIPVMEPADWPLSPLFKWIINLLFEIENPKDHRKRIH